MFIVVQAVKAGYCRPEADVLDKKRLEREASLALSLHAGLFSPPEPSGTSGDNTRLSASLGGRSFLLLNEGKSG